MKIILYVLAESVAARLRENGFKCHVVEISVRVAGLLNREDVSTIYVCTDSGREGEYIYRLVDQMAHVPDTKDKRRVWIDSQTE